jgi:DNA mismatch repair protein MLH3
MLDLQTLMNPQSLQPLQQMYLAQLDDTCGAALLPPGVLRALKSKACRSAIMFGRPLTHGQCVELLAGLSATRAPFMCAHGRPTAAPLAHLPTLRAAVAWRASQAGWLQRAGGGSDGGGGANAAALGGDGSGGGGPPRPRLTAHALRRTLAAHAPPA